MFVSQSLWRTAKRLSSPGSEQKLERIFSKPIRSCIHTATMNAFMLARHQCDLLDSLIFITTDVTIYINRCAFSLMKNWNAFRFKICLNFGHIVLLILFLCIFITKHGLSNYLLIGWHCLAFVGRQDRILRIMRFLFKYNIF